MTPIFGGRSAVLLVCLSLFSLLALILLLAFAQDLFTDRSDGADALSKSAVGFAGLKELLDNAGIPAEIGRDPLARGGSRVSLTILTPPGHITGAELFNYGGPNPVRGPILIVPDKWIALPMPQHDGWVVKAGAFPTSPLQGQLTRVMGRVEVHRLSETARPRTAPSTIHMAPTAPNGVATPDISHIDQLQTLRGAEPLIDTPDGALLVSHRRFPIWLLSDPDLLNNHALADQANARFALSLIRALRLGTGPVRFDVTLNGFGREPSLLRALFVPPFLGATIAALIAALLIGFHAWARFGAPRLTEPVFARGRTALAANSADLVRMMHREGAMAPRYLASARALALEGLGRPAAAQADELLAALERSHEQIYADLMREARAARSGADLLALARKAYAWRRRITGG